MMTMNPRCFVAVQKCGLRNLGESWRQCARSSHCGAWQCLSQRRRDGGGVQGWEGLGLGPMEKPWERLLDFVRQKVGASEPKAVLSSSRAGAGV